ncbi:MAG: hypothetical protein ACC645_19400, partial [Pirellulales bacterium]
GEPADLEAINFGLPSDGLVVALALSAKPGELAFIETTVDDQGLPHLSELFTARAPLPISPTAIAVEDFSPNQDGVDDVVVAGVNENNNQPFLTIFEALSIRTYPNVGEVVPVAPEVDKGQPTPFITQLTVARLNDDNIPDLAATLPDYDGGKVAIFRTRPPPCAVAVTTAVHGHLGVGSALPFLNWPLTVESITEFNAAGKERVQGQVSIMSERRPSEFQPDDIGNEDKRDLCPIGHIAVDGRWENLTTPGATSHFVARGTWLGAWIIPGAHSLFGGSPKVFWSVEIPITLITAVLFPPVLGFPARARLGLVATGAGVEMVGRIRSGRASRLAATNLAAAIDEAVALARGAMDTCTGLIFFDMIGHSRGTAQISAAAQMLAGTTLDALDHNTLATMIYLDAIDPITEVPGLLDNRFGPYGDALRPWAHSGAFVGDPWIVRLGNETVSSVRYATAMGMPPYTDWIENFLFNLADSVDLMRDIVGSPVGHARDQTTFSGLVEPGEWFPAGNGNHNSALAVMNAGALKAENYSTGVTPDNFHFQYLSSIGRLYPDAGDHRSPYLGPRAILTADTSPDDPADLVGVGWVRTGSPGEDLSHVARMPDACQTGTEPRNPEPDVADLTRPLGPYWQELVNDATFAITSSIVRGARAAVDSGQLDDVYLPDFPEMKVEVEKIATGQFPSDGLWTQTDRDPNCGSKPNQTCATVQSGNKDDLSKIALLKLFGPYVADGEDVHDKSDQVRIAKRFKSGAELMMANDAQNFQTLVNYYGEAIGGGHSGSDNYLALDDNTEVVQVINLNSTAETGLVLTVEYELDPGGSLLAVLEGYHLLGKFGAKNDTGRTVMSVLATRGANGQPTLPDVVKLNGNAARIYRVSVVPERLGPKKLSSNGRHYELVIMPEGTDPQEAAALAARMRYGSKVGKLASFSNADALQELLKGRHASANFWLDASGKPDNSDTFFWGKGDDAVKEPFHWNAVESFDNKCAQKHHVFTYPDGTLGHAIASSRHDGQAMGFIVDYGQ